MRSKMHRGLQTYFTAKQFVDAGKYYLSIAMVLAASVTAGQELPVVRELSLNEIINMARQNSIASLRATTLKENRYWQWRTFRANYRPQLVLNGILPEFTRNNIAVTQPDGTIQFQPVTNDNSSLNLGITQNIGFSGAQIFANSTLFRFQDFDRRQIRYNGNPLLIGFTQPLFAFNQLSWDKKTEPLRFEESQKQYSEDIEDTGRSASTLFFNLLISQINHDIASKNKANNDTLYKIALVNSGLGLISKDELFQLRLASLNSAKALAQADLNSETAVLQLKSFIGYKEPGPFSLALPESLPPFDIDPEVAIREARNNKRQTVEYKRALLEAEREIARAQGENGLNASLFGTFGLTNRAPDIGGIYRDPRDQQSVRLGFRIPIVDWGRSASRIRTAEANKKLVEYTIAQEEIDFDQAIYTQVNQFNMIKAQMTNNLEADRTAADRYEIARNRYLLGDLSVTDLNIALQEKDQAKRDYILSLKSFWDAYFNIRVLTLYDFEKGRKIEN